MRKDRKNRRGKTIEEIYKENPWIHGAVQRACDPDIPLSDGDIRLAAAIANAPLFPEPTHIPEPRVRQVLILTLEGYSLKQIAEILCIGWETVRTYARAAREQFGVKKTYHAALRAKEMGFLDD